MARKKGSKNRRPYPRKKICKYGHDISIVGRNKHGLCIACRKEEATRPKLNRNLCINGHDINLLGRHSGGRCNACIIEYLPTYKEKNKGFKKEGDREYQMRNKLKLKAYLRAYYLKKRYNITVEDYNKLFEEQEGKCAGCSRHQSCFKKILVVDHDHVTGRIRGLLCDDCNTSLGKLLHDPSILRRLANYLEKN